MIKPPREYVELYKLDLMQGVDTLEEIILTAIEDTRQECRCIALGHASDNTDDNPGYTAAVEIARRIEELEVPK